jgi:hypothetical protein
MLGGEHRSNLPEQRRNILLDTAPQDLEVERKVSVGNDVTLAGDLPPGDEWLLRAKVGRQLLHRLADDVEVVEYTVKAQAVAEELIAVHALRVLDDTGASLLDVREELDRTPRHGRHPARRRCARVPAGGPR